MKRKIKKIKNYSKGEKKNVVVNTSNAFLIKKKLRIKMFKVILPSIMIKLLNTSNSLTTRKELFRDQYLGTK